MQNLRNWIKKDGLCGLDHSSSSLPVVQQMRLYPVDHYMRSSGPLEMERSTGPLHVAASGGHAEAAAWSCPLDVRMRWSTGCVHLVCMRMFTSSGHADVNIQIYTGCLHVVVQQIFKWGGPDDAVCNAWKEQSSFDFQVMICFFVWRIFALHEGLNMLALSVNKCVGI